jgi:hypothetical protein
MSLLATSSFPYIKTLQSAKNKIIRLALEAWRSGHRVRLKNRRSRFRIPPGCKVLALYTLQCCVETEYALLWCGLKKTNINT